MTPDELLTAVRNHWANQEPARQGRGRRMRTTTCGIGRGTGRRTSRQPVGWPRGIMHFADGEMPFRRKLITAARVPDYRFELIEKAAGLSTEIDMRQP